MTPRARYDTGIKVHTTEVEKSRLRHANEDAKKGEKEKGGVGGEEGAGGSRTATAVDESRKKTGIYRVA